MDRKIIEFAERKLVETPGEEFLGERIKEYVQIHLSFACFGEPEDYHAFARQRISGLALLNQCEFAVDANYCQDNPGRRSVILAVTGLRRKDLPQEAIERVQERVFHRWIHPDQLNFQIFMQEDMSHIDGEEFLRRKNIDIKMYRAVPLSVDSTENFAYLEEAETALAGEAMKKYCRFVTNMDYTFHDPQTGRVKIEATGWYLKSHNLKF